MVLERRDPLVITRPYYLESHDCGYCNCKKSVPPAAQAYPKEAQIPGSTTHVTIGCKVEQMTCKDYDEFMNLGFRRSGDFLYKGDMLRGCCRMYTIRTKLGHMTVSKEHRQVVNRFKKAIADPSDKNESFASGKKGKKGQKSTPQFVLSSLIEAEQKSDRFSTRFEPAKFSKEKFALYKKYQTRVHNDKPEDVTKSSFTNFLCSSPFLEHEVEGYETDWQELNSWVKNWSAQNVEMLGKSTRLVKRLGPTHECYYLDGKLIAISVLDFLPSGVSSVYLIWDPDYAHLSLGTLSGIREVQMCHELNLGYYYLGYYIEDCDKMRYKKKFGGEVLDVCNEVFVPLEDIRPMMKNDEFWVITEDGHDEEAEETEGEETEGEETEGEETEGEEIEEEGDDEDKEKGERKGEDGEENKKGEGEGEENEGIFNDKDDKSKGQCNLENADAASNCCKRSRISNGEALAVSNSNLNDTEPEEEGEHEVTLQGNPGSWQDNLTNVSREIYGNTDTYKVAGVAKKVLEFELKYTNTELPLVLPGAIPLGQLVDWIEEKALDNGLPVTVYSTFGGRMYESSIGSLPATERGHVIDFLRLFGLERTQSAILIV